MFVLCGITKWISRWWNSLKGRVKFGADIIYPLDWSSYFVVDILQILLNPKVNYSFINILTLILLLDRCLKSTIPHVISLKSISILSTHLHLGLQSGLFPEDKLPLEPHLAGVNHRIVFFEWHRHYKYAILHIFLSLPLPLSRYSPPLPVFNRPRSMSLS